MPQKFEREQVIVSSFHFYLRGDVTIVVMLGECQASHFYSSSLSYRQKDGIGGSLLASRIYLALFARTRRSWYKNGIVVPWKPILLFTLEYPRILQSMHWTQIMARECLVIWYTSICCFFLSTNLPHCRNVDVEMKRNFKLEYILLGIQLCMRREWKLHRTSWEENINSCAHNNPYGGPVLKLLIGHAYLIQRTTLQFLLNHAYFIRRTTSIGISHISGSFFNRIYSLN